MSEPRKEVKEAVDAWRDVGQAVRKARRNDGKIDAAERLIIKKEVMEAVVETAEAFSASKEKLQRIREFLEQEL